MDEEKIEYQFTGDISSLKQATQTALDLLDKYGDKMASMGGAIKLGGSQKAAKSFMASYVNMFKAVDKLESKLKGLSDLSIPSWSKEAEQLADGVQAVADSMSKLESAQQITTKDVRAMTEGLKKARESFESAGSGVDTLVNKELKFQDTLSKISEKSNKVGDAVEASVNKMASAFSAVTAKLSAPFVAISAKIQSFKDRATAALDRVKQVAEAAGSGFKRFKTDTEESADDAEAALRDYADASEEAGEKSKEAAEEPKGAFDKLRATLAQVSKQSKKLSTLMGASLTKNAHKASNAIETFKRAFGRIVLYKTIRNAISAVTNSLKEGIKNLYQYSLVAGTEFAKSMDLLATNSLYAKNSIGAMVAPLINSLAPAIDVLVDKFVTLTNAIGKAFAALTGKNTFSQAVKYATSYEDAVEGATKAQKSFTAGFDELNIIEDSAGGAGKQQENYGAMFEEVEIPSETLEWAEKVRPLFESLGNVIGAVGTVLGVVKDKMVEFTQSFTSDNGVSDWITRLTDTLNNLASWITEHSDQLADLALALGAIWLGFKVLSGVGAIVGIVVGALAKIASIPATFEAIATGIGALQAALAPLAGPLLLIIGLIVGFGIAIYDLWQTNEEFRDQVAQAWENIMGVISNAWTTIIQPILSYIGDTLLGLWREAIEPVFQKIIQIVLKLWNDVLAPLLNFFISNVGPTIVSVVKNIGNIFATVFKNIFGIIDGLLTALDGLIDFVVGVFTRDWKRALKGLKNIFIGMVNALLAGIESAVNLVVGGINGLLTTILGAVQGVVNSILGGIQGLLDLVGINISVPRWNEIPQIPYLELPKITAMATGGVVTGPTQALIGEGKYDEAVIPLGNSPQIEELIDRIGQRIDQGSGGQPPEVIVKVYIGDKEWDAFTYKSAERGKKLVGAQPIKTGG